MSSRFIDTFIPPSSSSVPPTVLPTSVQPLIGVETRDGSRSEVSIEFAITRAEPRVELQDIEWSYRSMSDGMEMDLDTFFNDSDKFALSDDLTSLTVFNVSLFDAGMFTLSASNEAGTHNATIQLSVHGECLYHKITHTRPRTRKHTHTHTHMHYQLLLLPLSLLYFVVLIVACVAVLCCCYCCCCCCLCS